MVLLSLAVVSPIRDRNNIMTTMIHCPTSIWERKFDQGENPLEQNLIQSPVGLYIFILLSVIFDQVSPIWGMHDLNKLHVHVHIHVHACLYVDLCVLFPRTFMISKAKERT